MDISIGEAALPGTVTVPRNANALVIFAHGSGSDRKSPRNGMTAALLRKKGIATLLFDLLTEKEKRRYSANVFDVSLLTARLADAVRWAEREPRTARMRIGLLGASTGAAAALNVAGARGADIGAVVSRGGRPDLADRDAPSKTTAPTLFIVGGDDEEVIPLNKDAASHMTAAHRVILVPGATHVFDEPGTLEEAARLSVDWFVTHLA